MKSELRHVKKNAMWRLMMVCTLSHSMLSYCGFVWRLDIDRWGCEASREHEHQHRPLRLWNTYWMQASLRAIFQTCSHTKKMKSCLVLLRTMSIASKSSTIRTTLTSINQQKCTTAIALKNWLKSVQQQSMTPHAQKACSQTKERWACSTCFAATLLKILFLNGQAKALLDNTIFTWI